MKILNIKSSSYYYSKKEKRNQRAIENEILLSYIRLIWQDSKKRYGEPRIDSDYVTESGSNPDELSLPPGTSEKIYYEYEVIKPIPATESIIAPWGGSKGGGLQYQLKDPILKLIDNGFLKVIRGDVK